MNDGTCPNAATAEHASAIDTKKNFTGVAPVQPELRTAAAENQLE